MCKSSVATRKLIGELRPQPLHGVDLIAKHSALAALRRRAERIEIGLIGRLAKSHDRQAEVARAVAEIQDADGGLQLCRRDCRPVLRHDEGCSQASLDTV